jgi:flavin-dependent dehydrogenase
MGVAVERMGDRIASSHEQDVAVIGGGPAGAMCALLLACAGARTSLVHWGGYAPGGIEFVSGRARHLIERHTPGFFKTKVPGIEINETISLWGTPEPVTFNTILNPWGTGVAVERSMLDGALRALASGVGGTEVEDGKVLTAERLDGRWRLTVRRTTTSPREVTATSEKTESSMYARFLVLATGRVAPPFPKQPPLPEPLRIALTTPLQTDAEGGQALYIEAARSGWWYALPASHCGYFIGFCITREELKRRQGRLKEFFLRELESTRLLSSLKPDMKSPHPISGRRADGSQFVSAAGEGWIAVGDAAYVSEPLSGMGIEWAIESAELGARALLNVLQRTTECNAFAELERYEDAIRQRVNAYEKTGAYRYARP